MRVFADPPSYLIRDTGDVRTLIYMLINEMYGKPVYNDIMVECYIKQILVQTYRLLLSVKPNVFVPKEGQKMIGQSVYSIIRYIDNNIYEIDSVRSIAENLGYSHSYLSHLFREKMGTTLQAYVSMKRSRQAWISSNTRSRPSRRLPRLSTTNPRNPSVRCLKKSWAVHPQSISGGTIPLRLRTNRKGGEEC